MDEFNELVLDRCAAYERGDRGHQMKGRTCTRCGSKKKPRKQVPGMVITFDATRASWVLRTKGRRVRPGETIDTPWTGVKLQNTTDRDVYLEKIQFTVASRAVTGLKSIEELRGEPDQEQAS